MATRKPFRKSQLIAYDNVAAGHDGVLSDPSGELVIKPCKQSEIDFYESTPAHPTVIPVIPNFLGVISLGADTNAAQAAGALVLPNATDPEPTVIHGVPGTLVVGTTWEPSNGARIDTDSAVVLENVAAGFEKPNILDVKLGARLWADDSPMAKRVRLDKIAEETTSKPLGLRIAGMKTYQGAPGDAQGNITPDGYRFYDKSYGRTFSVETIDQGFEEYFLLAKGVKANGSIRKVIRRFVEDLQDIESVIGKEESRMYSASLLFVYEGDQQALERAFATEKDIINSLTRKVPDDEDPTSAHAATTDSDPTKSGDTTNGSGTNSDLRTHTTNGSGTNSDLRTHTTNGSGTGSDLRTHTTNGSGTSSDIRTDNRYGEGEADGEEEEDEEEVRFPAIQSLKLIDFAHAEWTPGQGPDENILHGIRNTIKILTNLVG